MDWRAYQEAVAEVFRKLGCTVHSERSIEGVRSSHRVDGLVEFDTFGIRQRWIIETKLWDTPVSKEKVLVLIGVVGDTGAHRGLLFSESGFQSGAFSAAKGTNISLMDLEELSTLSQDDLNAGLLLDLEKRSKYISSDISSLTYITEETGRNSSYTYPNPAYDFETTGQIFGDLAILAHGFEQARFGDFPALIGFEEDHRTPIWAESLSDFISAALKIVQNAEDVWEREKRRKDGDE